MTEKKRFENNGIQNVNSNIHNEPNQNTLINNQDNYFDQNSQRNFGNVNKSQNNYHDTNDRQQNDQHNSGQFGNPNQNFQQQQRNPKKSKPSFFKTNPGLAVAIGAALFIGFLVGTPESVINQGYAGTGGLYIGVDSSDVFRSNCPFH